VNTTHRSIRNSPAAPGIARRYVGESLAGAPREVVDIAELMVSELATNCVRYVGSDFTVTIERTPQRVRVDVADGGRDGVEMQDPTPAEPTGRGLRIVDELADAWGVDVASGDGKSVWFTLDLPRA
jgi:anti-sigma regulatory factor (Ser/Thr protein kinase)